MIFHAEVSLHAHPISWWTSHPIILKALFFLIVHHFFWSITFNYYVLINYLFFFFTSCITPCITSYLYIFSINLSIHSFNLSFYQYKLFDLPLMNLYSNLSTVNLIIYNDDYPKCILILCLFPSNVLFFSISFFNSCLSISMILEKVRNKWIFLFSPNQSCQILYQFLFNDYVLCTSNILIPLFQSTLSSTHQCLFVISSHFCLLLLSSICNIQILTMFLCNFGSCLILSIFNYSNLLSSYYFYLQY